MKWWKMATRTGNWIGSNEMKLILIRFSEWDELFRVVFFSSVLCINENEYKKKMIIFCTITSSIWIRKWKHMHKCKLDPHIRTEINFENANVTLANETKNRINDIWTVCWIQLNICIKGSRYMYEYVQIDGKSFMYRLWIVVLCMRIWVEKKKKENWEKNGIYNTYIHTHTYIYIW